MSRYPAADLLTFGGRGSQTSVAATVEGGLASLVAANAVRGVLMGR